MEPSLWPVEPRGRAAPRLHWTTCQQVVTMGLECVNLLPASDSMRFLVASNSVLPPPPRRVGCGWPGHECVYSPGRGLALCSDLSA